MLKECKVMPSHGVLAPSSCWALFPNPPVLKCGSSPKEISRIIPVLTAEAHRSALLAWSQEAPSCGTWGGNAEPHSSIPRGCSPALSPTMAVAVPADKAVLFSGFSVSLPCKGLGNAYLEDPQDPVVPPPKIQNPVLGRWVPLHAETLHALLVSPAVTYAHSAL